MSAWTRARAARRPAESSHERIDRAIDDFRRGDRREESFRTLFEVYYPPVRAFFAKRLRGVDESLDLTQETFTRVYRSLADYRGDGPFGAWLFRIAWNVLHDRRSGATAAFHDRQLRFDDVETSRGVSDSRDCTANLDARSALERVLDGETRRQLRDAVTRLPTQRRRCIVLWAYHELSYEQIATTLQLSIGTVKAHLSQARRQLAVLVDEDRGESDDG
ncbi:MAG: RNA polymerase sigma factor [Acidobacteriota bacterium]